MAEYTIIRNWNGTNPQGSISLPVYVVDFLPWGNAPIFQINDFSYIGNSVEGGMDFVIRQSATAINEKIHIDSSPAEIGTRFAVVVNGTTYEYAFTIPANYGEIFIRPNDVFFVHIEPLPAGTGNATISFRAANNYHIESKLSQVTPEAGIHVPYYFNNTADYCIMEGHRTGYPQTPTFMTKLSNQPINDYTEMEYCIETLGTRGNAPATARLPYIQGGQRAILTTDAPGGEYIPMTTPDGAGIGWLSRSDVGTKPLYQHTITFCNTMFRETTFIIFLQIINNTNILFTSPTLVEYLHNTVGRGPVDSGPDNTKTRRYWPATGICRLSPAPNNTDSIIIGVASGWDGISTSVKAVNAILWNRRNVMLSLSLANMIVDTVVQLL